MSVVTKADLNFNYYYEHVSYITIPTPCSMTYDLHNIFSYYMFMIVWSDYNETYNKRFYRQSHVNMYIQVQEYSGMIKSCCS